MASTYCAQADIEQVFGPTKISGSGGYADLDDDNDATKISNRIAQSIAVAGDWIDDLMRRTAYRSPLVDASGKAQPSEGFLELELSRYGIRRSPESLIGALDPMADGC